MNGTDTPEPRAEPAPAPEPERSYDLCPHCGGPMLRNGESNPPGYREYHVQADDAGLAEPKFCCKRQADDEKQRQRDRKANAQRRAEPDDGR